MILSSSSFLYSIIPMYSLGTEGAWASAVKHKNTVTSRLMVKLMVMLEQTMGEKQFSL